MFGGISKYAIAGLLVALVAGTAFHYYKVTRFMLELAAKDKVIAERDQQILALQSDVADLKQSNTSLDAALEQKREESAQTREQLAQFRLLSESANSKAADLEKRLRDRNFVSRKARIERTRKVELLLRLENSKVRCNLENYGRIGGRCIRGKWVAKGERLVPKADVSDAQDQAAAAGSDE